MKSIRCWIVNRWSVALCTLALLCVPAVLVHAQDYDAAARDQVIALEKAWNQAYKAGDTKALAAVVRGWKELAINESAARSIKVPIIAIVGGQDPHRLPWRNPQRHFQQVDGSAHLHRVLRELADVALHQHEILG